MFLRKSRLKLPYYFYVWATKIAINFFIGEHNLKRKLKGIYLKLYLLIFHPRARDAKELESIYKIKTIPQTTFFDLAVLMVEDPKTFISSVILQLNFRILLRHVSHLFLTEYWLQISWRIRIKIKFLWFCTFIGTLHEIWSGTYVM